MCYSFKNVHILSKLNIRTFIFLRGLFLFLLLMVFYKLLVPNSGFTLKMDSTVYDSDVRDGFIRVIPMFVMVLSVQINHEHRDCTVPLYLAVSRMVVLPVLILCFVFLQCGW